MGTMEIAPPRGFGGVRYDLVTERSLEAKIAPSLLACDLADMAGEAERVMAAGADLLHIDARASRVSRSRGARRGGPRAPRPGDRGRALDVVAVS